MKKKFVWGKVIERFTYNFDGWEMEVIKYHPWKQEKEANMETIKYCCDEISQISDSLFTLLIAWIAYKKIGLNQSALVGGISRALKLDK